MDVADKVKIADRALEVYNRLLLYAALDPEVTIRIRAREDAVQIGKILGKSHITVLADIETVEWRAKNDEYRR